MYFLFHINFLCRCAFFIGEIDKPVQGILQRAKRKAVNVGVCLEGVYVMDVKEKVSSWFSLVKNIFHTLCVCITDVHSPARLKALDTLKKACASADLFLLNTFCCSMCCWACASTSFPGTTATPRRRGTRTFCGWSLMERKMARLSTSC